MQRTLLCTVFSLALLSVVATATAQNYTKPTKEHEALQYEVGTWDAEATIWASPDAEPIKSKAVEKNEMLGKMWLMSKFETEFNGEEFVGASATGYDPIKKKYIGGWVDSMSPFMMKLEGEYDDDSKTLTMIGLGTEVMTGKPEKLKLITKYESQDKKTFAIYRLEDGDKGEWKTMEIKYTRQK